MGRFCGPAIWAFHGGNLFISGRLKDVIIVHGRNHYPGH
jgi:acyl-CoA synthetase (AMP-forming)/AMP-acid ligase II